MSKKEKADWNKKVTKLTEETKKLENEIEEIKANKIFENAFEWRFEFPEVLNDDGDFVGFDLVIGNPPYIKERDAKLIFEPLRKAPQWKEYIEGKMDLWYFFLHHAFNITKEKGNISYITNSYWMKSDGAKKLISRIYNEKIIDEIVYFDNYPIFEEVSGKHMIHSYVNAKSENHEVKLIIIDNSTFHNNIDNQQIKFLDYKNIINENNIIIESSSENFFNNCKTLDDFYETSVGVQESPDKLASKNILEKVKDKFKAGEGVFVINKEELNQLNLTNEELKIIKPYLNSSHLGKYAINFKDEYLIFSDKINRKAIEENKYSNIKKHLDKYKEFITSSNAPYGLHRDRSSKENPFEQPKLICKGMFATPEFTYDESKYYVGFSFSVITSKDENYSLKYLLSLINSKLGNYWFQINGKKRGIGVDIGVKVFRLFPVKKTNKENQQPFIEIVNEILLQKQANSQADTTALETQIDQLVYQLYELTEEEIKIVEGV
jgi:adenine-specific DNA-methyltransferase